MKVLWDEQTERYLFSLPPADAERIIDAVEELAQMGRGFVRRTFNPPERRLYVRGFVITFETTEDVMFVLYVRRFRHR